MSALWRMGQQWAPRVATIARGGGGGGNSRGYTIGRRDFTTPAIVTLVLYFVGFGLVGLIANVVYLNQAKRVEADTGEAPEGKGCLVALLWWFSWIPLVVFGLYVMIAAATGK